MSAPSFDRNSYDELDKFALLCDQKYNFGNVDRWFLTFRRSYYGFLHRVAGACQSYAALHSIKRQGQVHTNADTDLGNLFFNMDSSLECLAYAFNALGRGTIRNGFHNITDRRTLRNISPKDLTGNPDSNPAKLPLSGFSVMLPSVVALWQSMEALLRFLIDTHDVSKHRQAVFSGAKITVDNRDQYDVLINSKEYQALSKEEQVIVRINWPSRFEDLTLHPDPKEPYADMAPLAYEDLIHLDAVVSDWTNLINETGKLAVSDVRKSISLPVSEFREG